MNVRDVIAGCLLGHARITVPNKRSVSPRFEWDVGNESFANYIHDHLVEGGIRATVGPTTIQNYQYWRVRSRAHPILAKMHKQWYHDVKDEQWHFEIEMENDKETKHWYKNEVTRLALKVPQNFLNPDVGAIWYIADARLDKSKRQIQFTPPEPNMFNIFSLQTALSDAGVDGKKYDYRVWLIPQTDEEINWANTIEIKTTY